MPWRRAAAGFRTLTLVATLPGEPLYQALGFTVTERFQLRLPDAVEVPVARMSRHVTWIPTARGGRAILKIWVDADAAPRDVKELVFRAAKRLQVATVLVANQRLQAPPGNPLVTTVRVDGGPDVADQYIAEHAEPGDLVVTQDIPLAALLVPKKVVVLDPRGEEHTAETIGERLSIRDFMDRLRLAGAVTGGPPPYDARAKQAFAAALDRALTRLLRGG